MDSVAGFDVVNDFVDGCLELLLSCVESDWVDRPGGFWQWGKRGVETSLHPFDFVCCFVIRGFGTIGDYDGEDSVFGVVKDDNGVAVLESDIVDLEIVGIGIGEFFYCPDVVVADQTDGASDQSGESFCQFGVKGAEEGLDVGERVLVLGKWFGVRVLAGGGLDSVFDACDLAGSDTDKAVSGQLFTASDAFEEEGVCLVVGELPVGTQRGFEVGERFGDDRNCFDLF